MLGRAAWRESKSTFIRFPFCMINEEIDDSNEKAHRGSKLSITGHVIL